MQPDYDCVVVGAGLVGAAQALALCQRDLSVLVIEAREPRSGQVGGDVRGLALSFSSRQLIEALGLWSVLSAQIAPIRYIHVSDQGRFGFTHLSADDVGADALGYVCPADYLADATEAALKEQCEVQWQSTLTRIDTGSEYAQIRIEGGAGTVNITTRLVIGADGMHSRVRETMGAAVQQRDYRQSAIVANLALQYPVPETAFERFTPSGPLALLPLSSGRHVAVRCCTDTELERLVGLSDKEYLDELAAGFGYRFGAFSDVGPRRTHKLVLQWADHIVDHRIALVGAAANTIHPNGAQGLNLGLRDAAALAASVGRVRSKGGDIGDLECLSEFATGRRADQRDVIRFTDTMAQVFASKIPLIGPLRDAVMLAADISPTSKRSLIRRATGMHAGTPTAGLQIIG